MATRSGPSGVGGIPLAYLTNIGINALSSSGAGAVGGIQEIIAVDPLSATKGIKPQISLTGIVSPEHGGTGFDPSQHPDGLKSGWLLAADGVGGWTIVSPSSSNTIWSGQGAPTSVAGSRQGDFYIDTFNWTIYGPKTQNWPQSGTSLIGPKGESGNSVLSGSVDPSNSGDGVDGDFYINTNSYQIFGPKLNGAWGVGKDLIGAQGEPGLTPVDNWYLGGDFFAGNVYTSGGQAWICLQDDLNSQIDPATATNPKWELFVAKGQTGAQGPTGLSVLNGTADPVSTDGRVGEFWLNTSNQKLYGPKDVSGWNLSSFILLKGQKGDSGNRFIPVCFNAYTQADFDTVVSSFEVSSTDAPNGFDILVTGFSSSSSATMHVSLVETAGFTVVDQGDINTVTPSTLTLTSSAPTGTQHYELRIKRVGGTSDNLVLVEIAYRVLL